MCHACRSTGITGRIVRRRIGRVLDLQDKFPCPFGVGDVGALRLRGLGDTIAAAVHPVAIALGLQDCGGCARRQALANTILPYKSADLPPKLG